MGVSLSYFFTTKQPQQKKSNNEIMLKKFEHDCGGLSTVDLNKRWNNAFLCNTFNHHTSHVSK